MPLPERPNYLRYAFLNIYNIGLLGAADLISLGTGDLTLAGIAMCLEALWLFVGSDTTPFRRWADGQHRKLRAEESNAKRLKRIGALIGSNNSDYERAQELWQTHDAMSKELEKNEHWGADMMANEFTRLDSLLDAFLEFAEAARRMERYVGGFSLGNLRMEVAKAKKKAAEPPSGDDDAETVALNAKSAEIVSKRLATLEGMNKLIQRARGQMSVIENTFRLLHDQIVSLQPLQDVHEQLDEIVGSVDAVRAVLVQGNIESVSPPDAPKVETIEQGRKRVRG